MQKHNKILAVDDNAINLDVIQEALGDEYDLKTATTGEEALEIAADFQPHVVLLDVMMPGVDGYEVCRKMRASETFRYSKIVMVSAKAITTDRLEGYQAGADDYIIKPFDFDELLAKVRVYLRLSTFEEMESLNEELQSTVQELQRANDELREFAHIVAHDLKTPLRGIGTLADWIATDYAGKLDEQGKEQLMMLCAKAGRMSTMIDSILRYSKFGRKTIEKRQVDSGHVLSEVICNVDPPKNIEITIENELPVLMCDRIHIIQIFQNLLCNAVQHIDKPEGHIKVGCTDQEGNWLFSVVDNGPGIEEVHFKRIFKLFQRLAPCTEADPRGIGLAIVKKLVDLNGGKVWVESEIGKGSTFFFTFPKQESEFVDSTNPETLSAI
jgi:signal transduction histidine kinase